MSRGDSLYHGMEMTVFGESEKKVGDTTKSDVCYVVAMVEKKYTQFMPGGSFVQPSSSRLDAPRRDQLSYYDWVDRSNVLPETYDTLDTAWAQAKMKQRGQANHFYFVREATKIPSAKKAYELTRSLLILMSQICPCKCQD